MSCLSEWVEPAVLANLIVAGAAIWYTLETQSLRRTSVKQLVLMRQSMSSAILPFVLAGYKSLNSLSAKEKQEIYEEIEKRRVRRIVLPGVGSKSASYELVADEVFEVSSTTDQIASHVFCVLFDSSKKVFKVSSFQLEVIAPREVGYFSIAKSALSIDDICELIVKLYEERGNYLIEPLRQIATQSKSLLIPFFFDIAGRLYAAPRPVHWDEKGEVSYGKSDLLQPGDFAEEFAPPFESTAMMIAKEKSKRRS